VPYSVANAIIMSKTSWLEEPPADTRRERRKQEIREKIMESAISLIESRGCDATTLEEICEQADVSRPTFYSYYPSKQDLIHALVEKLWLSVAHELTEKLLTRQASTVEYVETFFKLIRTEMARYSRLERELIRFSMHSDVNTESMNMLGVLTNLFNTVYTEGKKRGDIGNRYPVDFLAEMTMGGIAAVMTKWGVDNDYPVDKRLKQLADFTLQMIALEK
jgi:AcrR family transcriptional regulator